MLTLTPWLEQIYLFPHIFVISPLVINKDPYMVVAFLKIHT